MADEIREFNEVLDAELNVLRAAHGRRKGNDGPENAPTRASRFDLVGLALSGGGIRSATFNLGVLQGLASFKFLKKIDYLSTVSGGGYIGTWLTALIHRTRNVDEVSRRLDPERRRNPTEKEPEEIRFLRDYSNYLTPRKGLFGTDFWALMITYLRNLNLNLVILVLTLVALLVVPVLFISVYSRLASLLVSELTIVLSMVLFIIAGVAMVSNLSSLTGAENRSPDSWRSQRRRSIWFFVIIPVLLGTFLLNHWLWYNELVLSQYWYDWAWVTGLVYVGIWGIGSLLGYAVRSETSDTGKESSPAPRVKKIYRNWIARPAQQVSTKAWEGVTLALHPKKRLEVGVILVSGFFAGCVGGILLKIVTNWVSVFSDGYPREVILGVPLIVLVAMVTATLHIGLTGRGFSEETREWWSRLGADVTLVIFSLTAFFLLELYGSDLLDWLNAYGGDELWAWVKGGFVSGWLLTTLAGIVAGRSSQTGKPGSSNWLEIVANVAPYVFILGLVLVLQQLTDAILQTSIAGSVIAESPPLMVVCVVVLLFVASVLSWRIGVNDFSMHALYRNRLVRCYLGASNKDRNAQPFIDFDPDDDNIRIHESLTKDRAGRFAGPYPIINTALNLVKGKKLAWQQRKGASFTFTPLFSGFEHEEEKETGGSPPANLNQKGFRRSSWYGNDLTLGNVMAISGAAASPNMGYHTSAPLAFLMTIFNVRLGWWLGNPRYDLRKSRWRHSPPIGLLYLIFELFGLTNDESRYVYLSDGGHFENLGIYELVRRRCKLIIASDAGEDRGVKFGDLGNAIEKCRTDFGIDIEMDLSSLRPDPETRLSKSHCAVGKIRYDKADPKAPVGTLLYLKASLTGDEPNDVLRYKAENERFPHESTSDQWFAESQFESYRMLGYDILRSVFQPSGRQASRFADRMQLDAIKASLRRRPAKRGLLPGHR